MKLVFIFHCEVPQATAKANFLIGKEGRIKEFHSQWERDE